MSGFDPTDDDDDDDDMDGLDDQSDGAPCCSAGIDPAYERRCMALQLLQHVYPYRVNDPYPPKAREIVEASQEVILSFLKGP